MRFTVPAALAALAAMACCIPLGLAGAVGVLALGEMFTTLQPWFLGLAAVLLAIGAVQCFRGQRICRRRASAFSLVVLGLSAMVVVGVIVFPQFVAGWIADYVL
jgi:hypothetical protein